LVKIFALTAIRRLSGRQEKCRPFTAVLDLNEVRHDAFQSIVTPTHLGGDAAVGTPVDAHALEIQTIGEERVLGVHSDDLSHKKLHVLKATGVVAAGPSQVAPVGKLLIGICFY